MREAGYDRGRIQAEMSIQVKYHLSPTSAQPHRKLWSKHGAVELSGLKAGGRAFEALPHQSLAAGHPDR